MVDLDSSPTVLSTLVAGSTLDRAIKVAAVLLVLAVVLITILAGDPTTAEEKRDALNVGGALSVPLLLFGIVGATGEFRHRTLAPAVLISPHRGRLTLARLIAYVFAAAVMGVAMVVVALAIGLPLLASRPGPDLDSTDYATVIGGGPAAVTAVMPGPRPAPATAPPAGRPRGATRPRRPPRVTPCRQRWWPPARSAAGTPWPPP